MAIAMNTHTRTSSYTAGFGGRRGVATAACVVPAAAVWEPVARPAGAFAQCGREAGPVRGVRTLGAGDRTFGRTGGGGQPRVAPRRDLLRPETTYLERKSKRGNYLLGAVFGCAVFFGTVVAGLSGVHSEDAPAGMMPADNQTVQTVQAVIPR